MNSEIIAVGSELLLGQIANTNAQYLSRSLAEAGINVYYHTVVGDNAGRLEQILAEAAKRADLVIMTGGLGPTKDDLTKQTVADFLGRKLVYDDAALESIEAYYRKTGRLMTENNKRQALVIEGASVLPNNNGMAPGMLVDGKTRFVLMPGVPKEMKPMFTDFVIPVLRQGGPNHKVISRVLRFFGIGESTLETEIMDLIDQQGNPTIAPLAGNFEVTLRLTASAQDEQVADRLIDGVEKVIQQRVGEYFYGYGEKGLAAVTADRLKNAGKSIASAESLTGGLFSATLISVPGASDTVAGGMVTYNDKMKKRLLNVEDQIIDQHGAVSRECAGAMAEGIRKVTGADIGISFTGVAGPGASEGHEPGTVFIGMATAGSTEVHLFKLSGNREGIRQRTVMHGLDLVRKHIEKNK